MAYRLLLLLVASFLASALSGKQADSAPEISADRIKAHVAASDRLEGRGPGTRGEFLATEYIAAEFKKAGLKPIGERGTYFQPVPLVRVVTSPKAQRLRKNPEENRFNLTNSFRNGHIDQRPWKQGHAKPGEL